MYREVIVELGALVLTGTDLQSIPAGDWSAAWPVVGRTVLERSLERLRNSGAGLVSVAQCDAGHLQTMIDWANAGVEMILVLALRSYAEIDVLDLMHFHYHGRNQVTQVFDRQGPLGVSLHDRTAVLMRRKREEPRNSHESSARYEFRGYVTRLSSTVAYHQLVQDALKGRCEIRPAGQQTQEDVWIDPSADIHPSVKIHAPCYVGGNTRLHAGVVIRRSSSVECGCEIDIGTTLDHACILPHTYLASGLFVSESIVDGSRLEHLGKSVTVDAGQAGLSARRAICAFHTADTLVARINGTRRVCTGKRERGSQLTSASEVQ